MQEAKVRILVLCTGNSCRSQMAQGFLRTWLPNALVRSAGTAPVKRVHPMAVTVMRDVGIDLSGHAPTSVQHYLNQRWDWVMTVCGGAKESCPVFTGQVRHRIHIGFDDPAKVTGTPNEVRAAFERIRDEIAEQLKVWVRKQGLG